MDTVQLGQRVMVKPNSDSGNVWGVVVDMYEGNSGDMLYEIKVPFLTFKRKDIWTGKITDENCRGVE
jgi:hypothetical protein